MEESGGTGCDPRVHMAKTNRQNQEDQIVQKDVKLSKKQCGEFPDTRINIVVDTTKHSDAPT